MKLLILSTAFFLSSRVSAFRFPQLAPSRYQHKRLMGKSSTASAAIGFRVQLSELIELFCEENFDQMKNIFDVVIIEDENDFLNGEYSCVTEVLYEQTNEYKTNKITFIDLKNMLISESKSREIYKSFALVPTHIILNTERWGYTREGTNASSRDIESLKMSKIKKVPDEFSILSKYPQVFIVSHCDEY